MGRRAGPFPEWSAREAVQVGVAGVATEVVEGRAGVDRAPGMRGARLGRLLARGLRGRLRGGRARTAGARRRGGGLGARRPGRLGATRAGLGQRARLQRRPGFRRRPELRRRPGLRRPACGRGGQRSRRRPRARDGPHGREVREEQGIRWRSWRGHDPHPGRRIRRFHRVLDRSIIICWRCDQCHTSDARSAVQSIRSCGNRRFPLVFRRDSGGRTRCAAECQEYADNRGGENSGRSDGRPEATPTTSRNGSKGGQVVIPL